MIKGSQYLLTSLINIYINIQTHPKVCHKHSPRPIPPTPNLSVSFSLLQPQTDGTTYPAMKTSLSHSTKQDSK